MTELLSATDLNVRYGHVTALRDVSVRVGDGEIVAVVGANGAGKSSLLRAIMGQTPSTGTVTFDGHRIDGQRTHRRVRSGMTLVPEGRGVMAGLTVRENLMLGGYIHRRHGGSADVIDEVFAKFPILSDRSESPAGLLSGGEQQMLVIGRALASQPRLLLLDEPSLGLAPKLVTAVLGEVSALRDRGVTVMLVEQNVRQALKLADRAYVLENGRITMEGGGAELLADTRVSEAFLGAAPTDPPTNAVNGRSPKEG